eukprot:1147328-Rhodomonas_salina.2
MRTSRAVPGETWMRKVAFANGIVLDQRERKGREVEEVYLVCGGGVHCWRRWRRCTLFVEKFDRGAANLVL